MHGDLMSYVWWHRQATMMAYAIVPVVSSARLVSMFMLLCRVHGLSHDIGMTCFAYDMGMSFAGRKVWEGRSCLGIVPPYTACIPLLIVLLLVQVVLIVLVWNVNT
jgi:hypothetical protein